MGASNSVKKLLEQDARNKKRLEEISAELVVKQTEMEGTLRSDQRNFYINDQRVWKFSDYVSGANSDFQTSATWSLENLSDVIRQITEAVLGALGPVKGLPDGVTAAPDVEEINEEGGLTKDVRLLVAANCLNLLTGLAKSFGKSSKVQVSTAKSMSPVGRGLRIFASVSCSVTQEKGFFNNTTMCSYRYGYLVSYSLDEFLEQAEMTLVAQYELTLNAYNIASKENYNEFVTKKIDIVQYKEVADLIAKWTAEIINEIKVLNQKDGASTRTLTVYQRQIDFLKNCLVDYGFDPEVSKHINAQIVELSNF